MVLSVPLNFYRTKLPPLLLLVVLTSACTHSSSPKSILGGVNTSNMRSNSEPTNSMINGYWVVRNDQLNDTRASVVSHKSKQISAFAQDTSQIDPSVIYQGSFPPENLVVSTANPSKDTLMLGLPLSILGSYRSLGAVITQIQNSDNRGLGGMKFANLPLIRGKLMLAALDTASPQLVLVGCDTSNRAMKCTNTSPQVPIFSFPVASLDTQKETNQKTIVIDISALGKSFDFINKTSPNGQSGYQSRDAVATNFDYTDGTLVFDVSSNLSSYYSESESASTAAPESAALPSAEPTTAMTARWFLVPDSAFDSNFKPQAPTQGVGFFLSGSSGVRAIERYSLEKLPNAGMKYYVTHVPAEWQDSFKEAFESWNQLFQTNFGRPIFDYEFIPDGDPRNAALVAGDIRYNIVDWDLMNIANYAGLTLTNANPVTGEILGSGILIQGPNVLATYTNYFAMRDQELALKAKNPATQTKLFSELKQSFQKLKTTHALSLQGKALSINSEMPSREDPASPRDDYDLPPLTMAFKDYMHQYLRGTLEHELGHALGLRHNFKGNLGANETENSRSIMEYVLTHNLRQKDALGAYDAMAIRYGYAGMLPEQKNWYCTDEDQWDGRHLNKSPECSQSDATADPFGYFESRLSNDLVYLLAQGETFTPLLTFEDTVQALDTQLDGLLAYARVNEAVFSTLSSFRTNPSRPSHAAQMGAYVASEVQKIACDPSLDDEVLLKMDLAGQALARENLLEFRTEVINRFEMAGIPYGLDANCKKNVQ